MFRPIEQFASGLRLSWQYDPHPKAPAGRAMITIFDPKRQEYVTRRALRELGITAVFEFVFAYIHPWHYPTIVRWIEQYGVEGD